MFKYNEIIRVLGELPLWSRIGIVLALIFIIIAPIIRLPFDIFFIFLFAVLLFIGGFAYNFYLTKSWIETDAKVIFSSFEKINARDFSANFKYSYGVDGKEYVSSTFMRGLPSVLSKKYIPDFMNSYASGDTIRVGYDPKNPSQSSVITFKSIPLNFIIFSIILFGIVFGVIVGLVIMFGQTSIIKP